MTAPLVVLAALTVLGGALNLPHVATLHHWLEPVTRQAALIAGVTEAPPGLEYGLMGLAVVIAVAGIGLAVRLLKPAELLTPDKAPAEKRFA
jgi:NADH-quinone oxidoreductase subunit L